MKRSAQDTLGWLVASAGLLLMMLLTPGWGSTASATPARQLFGWGAYALAPALVLSGVALAFATRMGWQVRWQAVAWAELFALALLTALHIGQADPYAAAQAGRGGGVVGWAVAQLLIDLLGRVPAQIVTALGALAAAAGLWLALPADWRKGTWPRGFGRPGLHRKRSAAASRPAPQGDLLRAASAGLRTAAGTAKAAFMDGRRWLRAQGLRVHLSENLAAAWARMATWLADARAALPRRSRDLAPPANETPLPPPPKRRAPLPAAEPAPEPARKPDPAAGQRKPRGEGRTAARPDWLPPLDLLRADPANGGANTDARYRAQLIKSTLAEFGVPVEVVSIKEGPTVTQFGLEPGEIVRELRNGEVLRRRVSVASILRLQNDLALALAAPSLRIEAPVPGRPYVGIEVPNTAKTLVSLRSILESKEFARAASPLTVALGRDVSGDPVVADLTRMPHLLIAGATGSGKSVCINALICSLLMNNGPETVRLVMMDPKMVELPIYNGIPHLLGPVLTDPSHAAGALAWLLLQMDDRYRAFAAAGARNIVEYNRKLGRGHKDKALPYIVLIIDELADLMMTAADDIERQVCRLAQMARATGIHLVLATQRPSVDVITGLIKANFPARIAFAVTTQIDSRVILDAPGAEKLLGRGDMLFMAPDSAKLARIQGCFVSDQEIDRLVAFWKASNGEEADGPTFAPWEGLIDRTEDGRDELLEQALRLLETKSSVSTSMLQRQLRIGFPRAARLMEQLEEMGVVGPDEGGGRSRAVLLQATTGGEG